MSIYSPIYIIIYSKYQKRNILVKNFFQVKDFCFDKIMWPNTNKNKEVEKNKKIFFGILVGTLILGRIAIAKAGPFTRGKAR